MRAFLPVSYTHLDVYKRQVPGTGMQGGRCAQRLCPQARLERDGRDVYKRQAVAQQVGGHPADARPARRTVVVHTHHAVSYTHLPAVTCPIAPSRAT